MHTCSSAGLQDCLENDVGFDGRIPTHGTPMYAHQYMYIVQIVAGNSTEFL